MALRNLIARMRIPATASPLPLPCLSPAAGSRPFVTSGLQNGRRTLDFESASVEEIKRESEILSNKAAEALALIEEYNDILFPRIYQDLFRNMKLMAIIAIPAEILSWAIRSRQITFAHSE